MEYSFWRTRLSATGLTLPWQLVAAQEPGPMYFCGSVAALGVCAAAESAIRQKIPLLARAARRLERMVEGIAGERKTILEHCIAFSACFAYIVGGPKKSTPANSDVHKSDQSAYGTLYRVSCAD